MFEPADITILLVDDDRVLRQSLATYLDDSGYQILEAEDGKQGLEAVRAHNPDLVLMDLRMPVMDGLTALPIVVEEFPETPVIIVSGMGTLDDSIKALRAGAWDYITKPIHDMAFLEHAVVRALERAALIRENRKYHEHLEAEVQKRTQELEEKNRMLLNSRRLFRSVADSAKDAIIAINALGEIIIWNDGAASVFGCDREEMIGQPISHIMPERYREHHDMHLRHAHEARSLRQAGQTLEAHGLHKDGTEFPVEMSFGMWDAEGEIYFSAVIRDVTERKKAASDLLQAQKMDALGKLAGGIAHDFNNMLLPIISLTGMMLKSHAEDDKDHMKLQKVLEAAERARSLVARILSFSHREEPAAQELDLAKVVHDTEELLISTLPKTITLESNIDDDAGKVLADASQLETVILNLASNAMQAIEDPTGTIRLELTSQTMDEKAAKNATLPEPGRYAVLRLSDTGTGMSLEVMNRLFEPFFTTKEVGQGTGLGLAMVHGIISAHKGAILVSSVEGEGSTFTIYLPLI